MHMLHFVSYVNVDNVVVFFSIKDFSSQNKVTVR